MCPCRPLLLLFVAVCFDRSILLILVLGDQITNVLISLLELHLVHALSLVPVEEGLPLVHSSELGGESLEDALERGGVGNECARLLGVLGGHFDNRGLHVVGDPLDEVVGVGALALLDVLVNLLRGHGSPMRLACGTVQLPFRCGLDAALLQNWKLPSHLPFPLLVPSEMTALFSLSTCLRR